MIPAAKVRTVDLIELFCARAEARALLWHAGELDLHTAVDELALAAGAMGLDTDEAQRIMSTAFALYRQPQS